MPYMFPILLGNQIGNHRDSWSFGALDPSSGTASMLEVVRSLGKVMKEKSIQENLLFYISI